MGKEPKEAVIRYLESFQRIVIRAEEVSRDVKRMENIADRGGGSSARLQTRLAAKRAELASLQGKRDSLLEEIQAAIDAVPDADARLLLEARYLDGKSVKEFLEENPQYTRRTVYNHLDYGYSMIKLPDGNNAAMAG